MRRDAILALIKDNQSITRQEMATKLNVNKKTIERMLATMTDIVTYEGSSKQGYWAIKK